MVKAKVKQNISNNNIFKGRLLDMVVKWVGFVPLRIYTVTDLHFEKPSRIDASFDDAIGSTGFY